MILKFILNDMHKILLFLFFYLYLYQSVYAEYRQLKIPFRVAGEDVLSSAYLKIYVDNISRSYDDYVRWEGSGESIVNFLNSIQFQDTSGFFEASKFNENKFDLASGYFDAFSNLIDSSFIVNHLLMHERKYVTVRMSLNNSKRSLARVFMVNRFGLSDEYVDLGEKDIFQDLFATIFQIAENGNPEIYADSGTKYRLPIGSGLPGFESYIEFIGSIIEAKDDGQWITNGNLDLEALGFYRNVILSLKSSVFDFFDFFDASSKRRFESWAKTLPSDEIERYGGLLNSAQYLFFIDADPVFLIYKSINGKVIYDTVFKRGDGDFQLVNFSYQSFADVIFSSQEMFIDHLIDFVEGDPAAELVALEKSNEENILNNNKSGEIERAKLSEYKPEVEEKSVYPWMILIFIISVFVFLIIKFRFWRLK